MITLTPQTSAEPGSRGSLARMTIQKYNIEPRVGQLDASILDTELLELLRGQLFNAFKYFHPELKDKYSVEILLLLRLALFKVTVWDHDTTYGAKLQHLKLVQSTSRIGGKIIPLNRKQKLAYGAIVVGGSYLWRKMETFLALRDEPGELAENDTHARGIRVLRKSVDFLNSLWEVSTLANFVLFLYSGRYSTLILRLLRMRYVPITRTFSRQVNFEFQNRQLVWNALTEFLLFTLPLINLPRIKRKLSSLLRSSPSNSEEQGELSFLPEKVCAICYKTDTGETANSSTSVTNPYQGECGHIYCYVCLQTKILEDPESGWPCLLCSRTIKKATPFIDVDPSAIISTPQDKESDKVVDTAAQEVVTPPSERNNVTKDTPTEDAQMQSDSDSDSDYDNVSRSNFIVDNDASEY